MKQQHSRLLRVGLGVLALSLTVGILPFLPGWAAGKPAVSPGDIVSAGDAAGRRSV